MQILKLASRGLLIIVATLQWTSRLNDHDWLIGKIPLYLYLKDTYLAVDQNRLVTCMPHFQRAYNGLVSYLKCKFGSCVVVTQHMLKAHRFQKIILSYLYCCNIYTSYSYFKTTFLTLILHKEKGREKRWTNSAAVG